MTMVVGWQCNETNEYYRLGSWKVDGLRLGETQSNMLTLKYKAAWI